MRKFLVVVAILGSGLSLKAGQILPAGIEEGSKVTLKLEEDEVAIFGYGALMLEEVLRYTNERYTGPFIIARLKGFKRTWSAHSPNKPYVEDEDEDEEIFIRKSAAYLNVETCANSKVNGMVFVCSKEDLKLYDYREGSYDRVRINDKLEGVTIVGGDAYVYMAKPECYMATEDLSIQETIIYQFYIDIIAEALGILGEEFSVEFSENTQPVPWQLVWDL